MDLTPPPTLNVYDEPTTIAVRWRQWHQNLELYFAAMNITAAGRMRATLLYCAGQKVKNIVDNNLAGVATATYAELVQALNDHFGNTVNLAYERFEFGRLEQKPGETIDSFYGRLKHKAQTCGYVDLEESILRDRIIAGCVSPRLMRQLLRRNDISLTDALTQARAFEVAEGHADEIEASFRTPEPNRTCMLSAPLHRPAVPFKVSPAY